MLLLKKLLNKLYKMSAFLFPAAKEDELKFLQESLKKQSMPALPNEYISFLKLSDGMTWNGLRFFGAKPYKRDEQGYTFPSLLEINTDYWQRDRGFQLLIIGEADEQLIVYSKNAKMYQLINKMDLTAELNLPRFFDIVYYFAEDYIKQPTENKEEK